MSTLVRVIIGSFSVLFGLVTIAEGGQTFFSHTFGEMALKHIIPFVLLINFISGFFYAAAGILLLLNKPAAVIVAKWITVSLALLLLAAGGYILADRPYLPKTIGALLFRLAYWAGLFFYLQRNISSPDASSEKKS